MSISKRTQSRIEAIKFIYEALANHKPLVDYTSDNRFLELEEDVKSFYNLAVENGEEAIMVIKNNLKKYSFERLNLMDQAILVLAVSELIKKDTPRAIVINEALVISELYTKTDKDNTVKFNNRLLDDIANSLEA